MESPIAAGDTTTTSLNQRLTNTHLSTNYVASVNAAIYSGEKCIQLVLKFPNSSSPTEELVVLRRVQDSYVNITQLLDVLIHLKLFKPEDVSKFINHEVKSNPQYFNPDGYTAEYNDLSENSNKRLQGVWIPFDKAVSLSTKLDVYPLVKKLFLIDVHDFDELPKHPSSEADVSTESKKRKLEDGEQADEKDKEDDKENTSHSSLSREDGKSVKRFKSLIQANSNYPYPLVSISVKEKNHDVVHDVKQKFGEVFKTNESKELSVQDIQTIFEKYLPNKEDIVDFPLDNEGKTALHYASTLASLNLVSGFINLGLNSPIRGTKTGENPLIACIKVTNAMEKGNFPEILSLLSANIFLINNKNASFLHFLAGQSKKLESCRYYVTKILNFILGTNTNQFYFKKFLDEIVNLQDSDGNTALHLAIENENKWLIQILIELKADLNLANKANLKPIEFDIVKEVLNYKKLGMKNDFFDSDDDYLVELIQTNFEALQERMEVNNNNIIEDEEMIKTEEQQSNTTSTDDANQSQTATNKLFNSINDLLKNTNKEYANLMNTKKQQINDLNKQLYETTLVTANNKFLNRKIHEQLMYLDNLKLQMTNITEKLETIRNEIPNDLDEKFDADQPFRIDKIYDTLIKDGDISELKHDEELVRQLPDANTLKARINSYKQLNEKIEGELNVLSNYSTLTSKFKKVVSFCTGVDINEVDELLDGLLEAVESQS